MTFQHKDDLTVHDLTTGNRLAVLEILQDQRPRTRGYLIAEGVAPSSLRLLLQYHYIESPSGEGDDRLYAITEAGLDRYHLARMPVADFFAPDLDAPDPTPARRPSASAWPWIAVIFIWLSVAAIVAVLVIVGKDLLAAGVATGVGITAATFTTGSIARSQRIGPG